MYYFAAGDAGFYFVEQLQKMPWLPKVWHAEMGYGSFSLFRLWFDYPYQLFVKLLASLGLSWFVIDKLLWILIIGMMVYSSYKLAHFIIESRAFVFVSSILYCTNSYVLLLLSGGQVGVAAAYAVAPMVLYRFMKTIDTAPSIKQSLLDGVWIGVLIACDLRLTYIMIAAIFLYGFVKRKLPLLSVGISFFIASLLHAFWILPTVLSHANPGSIGEDFTNPGMLKFLSVADFSHTISLLHPNWPENLFGKVYFLQPEFLLLPIAAFFILLLLQKAEQKKTMLYFALLALIGAFFAKGVNAPFGFIFQWAFVHIPGFVMFRDPTKFYLLTAIGYSILIPSGICMVTKKQRHPWIPVILCMAVWLFTVRAVFNGQVKGNFFPLQFPKDYMELKNTLVADTTPSRAMYIPEWEKFAYTSDTHPFLSLQQVFPDANTASVSAIATDSSFLHTLTTAGVRYVVVPIDVEGKLFMRDYQHDETARRDVIASLQKSKLHEIYGYQQLAVFENPEFTGTSIITPASIAIQERYATIGVIVGVITLIGIGAVCLCP